VLLTVALPLLLPVFVLLDLVRGARLPRTRLLLFAAYYLVCEILGLLASFLLWGLQRLGVDRADHLQRHYVLQRWWAGALFAGMRRLFDVDLESEGEECIPGGPVLVFIRHASLADTLLPAVLLSERQGLRLRYVLKRELLWDPCLDVVGNRLPNLFVRRESGESAVEVEKVARLARGLSEGEGVLIYPEGTRFTPARRERALARIERTGSPERLERARALQHVLPPRTGGPLALLEACPEADVLVVAHVGFDGISHLREVWRGALIGRRVCVRFWRVPRSSVPEQREKQVGWLYDQWQQLDAWIASKRPIQ
jgi:1-acyl-sn-glycerol-3-phosphate acyltransferase